jgi:hypothetical protein
MKDISEITVCVWDYGTFLCLAEMFGRVAKKTYFHSPYEDEYREAGRCVVGDGLSEVENFERIDQPLDPEKLDEIDLFVFPDIGFGGVQRLLRERHKKAVWGAMGASDLELYRTRFVKTLKSLGLPVVGYVIIKGTTNLSIHLKEVENKWVKVNRFRANMETWHHIDWDHSKRDLEHLEMEFGSVKEEVTFVVQDDIETDIETGYDGWTVDGRYPDKSFQGYEKKNELYLGGWVEDSRLSPFIKETNDAFSSVFLDYGYRGSMATEIRVKDDVAYFIDATFRMAGQTEEHLTESCDNFPEVIWKGANGAMESPSFNSKFVAEATMHYTARSDKWRTLVMPEESRRWFKLYGYCHADGAYQFPPRKGEDELGVVLGMGDTIEEAIDHLKENFDTIKKEPLSIRFEGFADLLKQAKEAEEEGVVDMDSEIPDPVSVVSE